MLPILADEDAAVELHVCVFHAFHLFLRHLSYPCGRLHVEVVIVHWEHSIKLPLVPFLPNHPAGITLRTGEHVGTQLLSCCMHGVGNAVHESRDCIAAELCPCFYLRRVGHPRDVDACLLLESSHAVGTITIVCRGILAVHVEAIFVPQPTGKYYIGITDVVELHEIDLRDGGNLLELVDEIGFHLSIARVERGVIRHISGLVGCRFAQPVHCVPAVLLAALHHRRHPGVILQAQFPRHFRRCFNLLDVHSGIDANARHAVTFPRLEVVFEGFGSGICWISAPDIHRQRAALGLCTRHCCNEEGENH